MFKEKIEWLRKAEIFAALGLKELELVAGYSAYHSCGPDEVIFS